eukprot:scaffold61357_cov75-Phaeocystis_antarctica.AAC.5
MHRQLPDASGGLQLRGFSFFSRYKASRATPDTLTTLNRTPGMSPTAWPFRPNPAISTSSCRGKRRAVRGGASLAWEPGRGGSRRLSIVRSYAWLMPQPHRATRRKRLTVGAADSFHANSLHRRQAASAQSSRPFLLPLPSCSVAFQPVGARSHR